MKLLLILFVLTGFKLCAQSSLRPYMKISVAAEPNGIGSVDAGLASGIHFNDYFSLQLGLYNIKQVNGQLDIVALSCSPVYRILKSKYPVSPVVCVDVGTQIWSNANNRFIQAGSNSNYRYRRGLFFSKVKLLTDFKVSAYNLNLMVGPTFNLTYFKIDKVKKTGDDYKVVGGYISDNYGFGFELSLMYTFPMKKRQAKNSDVGD